MGATCKTCTGAMEPILNKRRNTDTMIHLDGEGNLKENMKSRLLEEEPGVEMVSIDSTFLQDLARFIRTLPAKSKQHIWSHAVKIKGKDGKKKKVLDSTSNQDQINQLLCDNVIVYVKVRGNLFLS